MPMARRPIVLRGILLQCAQSLDFSHTTGPDYINFFLRRSPAAITPIRPVPRATWSWVRVREYSLLSP